MTALSRAAMGLAWLCLACLCAGSPVSAGESGRVLLIENPATGLQRELPLEGVRRVSIKFFHSYDRHWVEETFLVARGRFVPVQVEYSDDSYDYRDQRYRCRSRVGQRSIRLTDIQPLASDRLAEIRTRVAHIRSQRLILRGSGGEVSHLFTQWGNPGQPLVFSVK